MRLALMSLLMIALAVGCGGDSDKSREDTGSEADADADADTDTDTDDGQQYDAEDLETAFEVTAGVPFEHTYEFQVLGEGFYQRCDDIPDGLTIEGGGDSIYESIQFSGTLAEGIYELSIGIEDYQDGPSWYRTLDVTITAVAPETDTGTDTGDTGEAISLDQLVYADFEGRASGVYTHEMIAEDFGASPSWNNGIDEGRVSVQEEDGQRFLRVQYPTGGVGTSAGGCQFQVPLDGTYDDLYVSYRIRFGTGFDFVRGGKLPGLCGGACNTGGSSPSGTDGWSARMMWRSEGAAVQYMYHPDQAGTYGDDFYWNEGAQRHFDPGTWHTVQTRIVMNSPTENDGIVQSWFDGVLALDVHDVRYRDVDSFGIDTLYFSTFFGGSGSDWAPTADEYIDFDEITVATGR